MVYPPNKSRKEKLSETWKDLFNSEENYKLLGTKMHIQLAFPDYKFNYLTNQNFSPRILLSENKEIKDKFYYKSQIQKGKNNSTKVSAIFNNPQIALRNLLNFQNRMGIDIKNRQMNINKEEKAKKIKIIKNWQSPNLTKSLSKDQELNLIHRLSKQDCLRNSLKLKQNSKYNLKNYILNLFQESQSFSSSRIDVQSDNLENLEIQSKSLKEQKLDMKRLNKSREEMSQMTNFRSNPISPKSFTTFYNKELKFLSKRKQFISDMKTLKEKANLIQLKEYFHPNINNHTKQTNRKKAINTTNTINTINTTTSSFNQSKNKMEKKKKKKELINRLKQPQKNSRLQNKQKAKTICKDLKFSETKNEHIDSNMILDKKIIIQYEEKKSKIHEKNNEKLNATFPQQMCETIITQVTSYKEKGLGNSEDFKRSIKGKKATPRLQIPSTISYYSAFNNNRRIIDGLLKPVLNKY